MSWLEQKVLAYEHMRFAQEQNRRVLPFEWGLEHIGGSATEPNPRAWLDQFIAQTLAQSDDWFAATPANDYKLEEDVLTFTSEIESPWPANNLVHAQVFPARRHGPAVVVLAQWNARWEEQQNVCRWLNVPRHHRRENQPALSRSPRHSRAIRAPTISSAPISDSPCRPIGRPCWMFAARCAGSNPQGYDRLGLMGTSVGSCLAFLTLAHEPALRAAAFLHVSTYFGDVVAAGLTTTNVWEALHQDFSLEEVRHFWAPVSPYPYIPRLIGSRKKILAISGRYDPTFPHDLTQEFLGACSGENIPLETMSLPCGHYSMGVAPFSYAVGYRFGTFLFQALA